MNKSRAVLLFLWCVGLIGTIGCGSSVPRTLQSVTVSPATAEAQNFPNGEVRFVATAVFNKPPSPVTPYQVSSWLITPSSLATIDQNGVAKCVAGQSGTATIQIAQFGDGGLMNAAKLTCP
jgi:hypothetical protein